MRLSRIRGVGRAGALLAAWIVWLAVPGCSDRVGGGRSGARDSAGIRVVQAPPETAGAPQWRLEQLRLAGGTGDPGEGDPWFRRVSSLDLGPDGLLYVLDGLEKRVTVLDPDDGRVIRRFGREGSGPGEFRSPAELSFRPDGDLMVGERMPLYLHQFAPDGTHRSARLLDTRDLTFGRRGETASPGAGLLAEWGPPDPGGLFVRLLALSFDPTEAGRYALVRTSLDGQVAAELLTWRQPFSLARPPRLFEARKSWTSDRRGRLLVSPGERYEVRTYDASGRLIGLLRRKPVERPVTESLRRRARREFVEAMKDGGAPSAMLKEMAGQLQSASRLPAVQGLWTATPDGELWVGIPMARNDGRGTVEVGAFDVYSSGGELLARVPSPPGFVLHRVHGERVYGELADDLDVPMVAVFRLRRE